MLKLGDRVRLFTEDEIKKYLKDRNISWKNNGSTLFLDNSKVAWSAADKLRSDARTANIIDIRSNQDVKEVLDCNLVILEYPNLPWPECWLEKISDTTVEDIDE